MLQTTSTPCAYWKPVCCFAIKCHTSSVLPPTRLYFVHPPHTHTIFAIYEKNTEHYTLQPILRLKNNSWVSTLTQTKPLHYSVSIGHRFDWYAWQSNNPSWSGQWWRSGKLVIWCCIAGTVIFHSSSCHHSACQHTRGDFVLAGGPLVRATRALWPSGHLAFLEVLDAGGWTGMLVPLLIPQGRGCHSSADLIHAAAGLEHVCLMNPAQEMCDTESVTKSCSSPYLTLDTLARHRVRKN